MGEKQGAGEKEYLQVKSRILILFLASAIPLQFLFQACRTVRSKWQIASLVKRELVKRIRKLNADQLNVALKSALQFIICLTIVNKDILLSSFQNGCGFISNLPGLFFSVYFIVVIGSGDFS